MIWIFYRKKTIVNNKQKKQPYFRHEVGNVRPAQKPFFNLNCILLTYKNEKPASKSDQPFKHFLA